MASSLAMSKAASPRRLTASTNAIILKMLNLAILLKESSIALSKAVKSLNLFLFQTASHILEMMLLEIVAA